MGRVWSVVGFKPFFGKESILANHQPRLRGKRSSVTYFIEDSAGNIQTEENKILLRRRKYFKDLLNPVKASTRDTQEVIHARRRGSFYYSRNANGN